MQDTTPVKASLSLDLAVFCSQDSRSLSKKAVQTDYSLLAVSNHSGILGGGHYTATCKAISDQHWYSLNDTTVRRAAVPSSSLASEAAYVLFYERSEPMYSSLGQIA